MRTFFLDGQHLIKTDNEAFDSLSLFINGQKEMFSIEKSGDHLCLHIEHEYKTNDDYQIICDGVAYTPFLRFIYKDIVFDKDINILGSFVSDEGTIFRLFAPYAKEAVVIIDKKAYSMKETDSFLFEFHSKKNYEGSLYHYKVLREKWISFSDPFAYSAYNFEESYIIDRNKLVLPKFPLTTRKNKNDVIYELSVRDFSSSLKIEHPKKFLGLIESEKDRGFEYLCGLGISHIQIMPIFSFDKAGTDYNWGYNPLALNVLEEDYCVSIDPYKQLQEFAKVVETYHRHGIRVNLDLVFNHVYKPRLFNLARMWPYYCFRYRNDMLCDGTFCGNELASETDFMRSYFVLLINRMIELFDIDGIRFDLMGIMDIDTINEIVKRTHELKSDFLIYGEGWNMGEYLSDDKKADIENAYYLPDVSFFNGEFRDVIRGYNFYDYAYIFNDLRKRELVKKVLSANACLSFGQSINYLECHDDFTLADKISNLTNDLSKQKKIIKFSLALLCFSKGKVFIHSGQEFARSKNRYRNTYNLPDIINRLDWDLKDQNNDIVTYFRELLAFRDKYPVFYNDSECKFEDYYEVLIYHIGSLWIFFNPCEYDHLYNNGSMFKVLFDENGQNEITSQVLNIKANSVLVAIDL